MKTSQEWIAALKPYENEEKKKVLSQFFKTGKGEYGEGDVMVGICVPDNRRVARTAAMSDFTVIEEMLTHEVHEYRLSALLALVERYKKATATDKEEIVRFYLSHTACINNWDLVDLSAPYILGAEMLRTSDIIPALRLAESTDMWQQRIAIVSMLTFIRAGRFDAPYRLSPNCSTLPMICSGKPTAGHSANSGNRTKHCSVSFSNNMPPRCRAPHCAMPSNALTLTGNVTT